MTLRILTLGVLAMTACNGGDPDNEDDGPGPGLPDQVDDECGQTAPEIRSLEVTLDEARSTECEGVAQQVLSFRAETTDADGDLTYHTLRVGWDDVVDDRVRFESDGGENDYWQVEGAVDGDECKVFGVTFGMRLCLGNDPLPWNVELEFGAVVYDSEDNVSGEGISFNQAFTMPQRPE